MSLDARPAPSNRAIYLAALDVANENERQALLVHACGGDEKRRREIERLLAAHDNHADNAVDRAVKQLCPAATRGPQADTSVDVSEHPVIDRYKLLEQIGEGGMGAVFMAQQNEPIRRRVALKLIKPGLDSRDVIARFEAERQTLALMDHPNIARVLDAGTTVEGRPYFVMELVRGIPITDYCDANRLSLDDRLRLFIDICRAVQHAHQKGIIHRDLKPSNVMITLHDDTPVVKVIDFGVAKALDQELTEQTLFTHFSQIIGTPLYMSPEQAEMSGLDIDTRSDVYSLGVLLYELLTGTTPFDKETLSKAGFDGMRRIIREEEPPRPSHKISTLETHLLSTVSSRRKIDARQLASSMRRELDWIAMKALEKDRNRRYESASAMASDIQRYLDDDPVQACPPSAIYRLRKAARRNRLVFAGTSAFFAVLLAGIIGLSIANSQIADAQRKTRHALQEANQKSTLARARTEEAEAAKDDAEAARKEADAARLAAEQNLQQAMAAVDRLLEQVSHPDLKEIPQIQSIRQAILEDAIQFYESFVEQNGASPALLERAANTWIVIADMQPMPEAEASRGKALSIAEQLAMGDSPAPEHLRLLAKMQSRNAHGQLWNSRNADKARELFASAAKLSGRLVATGSQPESDQTLQARALEGLARALHALGRAEEATNSLRDALQILEATPNVPPEAFAATWWSLAVILAETDRRSSAEAARQSIAFGRRMLSQDDSRRRRCLFAWWLYDAAKCLRTDYPEEADAMLTESLGIYENLLVEYPDVVEYAEKMQTVVNVQLGTQLTALQQLPPATDASRDATERILESLRASEQRIQSMLEQQPELVQHAKLVMAPRVAMAEARALLGNLRVLPKETEDLQAAEEHPPEPTASSIPSDEGGSPSVLSVNAAD